MCGLDAFTKPGDSDLFTMLAATASGDAYTFTELESIAKAAGFARVDLCPVELGRNRLVIAHR